MPVLQKKALFSAFIICQVLRIIQNYMEVSPAKSLILSATIHGGSYFFIQPRICEFVNLRICELKKDATHISVTYVFLCSYFRHPDF